MASMLAVSHRGFSIFSYELVSFQQLEHQYTELSALNDILGRKLADIMKWRENSAVFINEAKSIDAEL